MSQHRTPSQPLAQLLSQRPLQAVSTGVHALDLALHGGLVPGQLYEFSGLNNTGKATLASQFCLNALGQHKRVLWVTMMQTLHANTLLRLRPPVDLEAPHARITHHRITSVAALFMLLMQLPTQYDLVIIEDFALAVNRSVGELDSMVEKPKVSLETRRTRTILEFMKCANFYCGKSKASCVFFNPVDTMSMSFVEVDSSIALPSTPLTSSSQSFNSSMQRPKKINQQVLVSALGDNSKWNSMFRARILLYKDWSMGNLSTATFAHIKHSPAMRRVLQAKGIQQRVVHFRVTKEGLKDATEPEDDLDSNHSKHEFTLDEKDLESDNDDEQGDDSKGGPEEHEEATHQGESTTTENENVLASSPCRDIQNARELLSSQMEELEKSGKSHLDITEEDLLSVQVGSDTNSTTQTPLNISDTTAAQEPQAGVEVDPLSNELEATKKATREVSTERNEELHNDLTLHGVREEETTREESEPQPTENIEELRIASMVSDKSFEVQEIDDELEELYPTQPEAIDVVRLSQLQLRPDSFKRSKTSPETYSKRLKIAGEKPQELDETIPSTFPFF